jgi:hypothetical protein
MSHHELVLSVPSDLEAEVQCLVTRQQVDNVSLIKFVSTFILENKRNGLEANSGNFIPVYSCRK